MRKFGVGNFGGASRETIRGDHLTPAGQAEIDDGADFGGFVRRVWRPHGYAARMTGLDIPEKT